MKKYLLVIIVTHVFILYNLIFFPYPEFFVYPYLTNNGLLPYKQIFDQHFPGLMFLPVNFNSLGMTSPEAARVWAVSIVIIVHLLLFFITSKILKNPQKALIANLFFLVWQPFLEGWVFWIDSLLPIFLLPAFYFLYFYAKKTRNSYLIWAGIFLGTALIFKQVVIPLIGLVFLYLVFSTKKLKPGIYFLAGLLPLPILMVIYFYRLGVLKDLWYWTIWFNLTTFAQFGRKDPTLSGLARIIFIYLPILLVRTIKENQLIILLMIFIFGSLASAISRFDFVHFQPSLPFIAILAALALDKLSNLKYFKYSLVIYFILCAILLATFYKGHISSRVLFFDQETYQVSNKIRSLAGKNQEIFLFGVSPHLYSLSETLPAGRVFVFQFPWFIMESENTLIEGLKQSRTFLVLRDSTVVIEGQKITDYAQGIDEYILNNYTEIDRIGNIQFLIRKKDYAHRF